MDGGSDKVVGEKLKVNAIPRAERVFLTLLWLGFIYEV